MSPREILDREAQNQAIRLASRLRHCVKHRYAHDFLIEQSPHQDWLLPVFYLASPEPLDR